MRRAAVAASAALVLTACGGGTKDVAPCLRGLGIYTNEGISADVHLLGRDLVGVSPPASLKRVTDLSFTSPGRGANSAQFFFHDSPAHARTFAAEAPRGHDVVTRGAVAVFFSSRPTPRQRAAVVGCLD